jgi:hypothetical protein
MAEGAKLLRIIQDVYLDKSITIDRHRLGVAVDDPDPSGNA